MDIHASSNVSASAAAAVPDGGDVTGVASAAISSAAAPSQLVQQKGIKRRKKKKDKDTDKSNSSSDAAPPPPPASPPIPSPPPAPPVASGSGRFGGIDSGGLSVPTMQQQGYQLAHPTNQEDDPLEEIEAKVEGLLTSYELLELGVGDGLETDDAKGRINDVTESWLELASSGRLSRDQIQRIRSQCTFSLATTATGKRKGRSSTGTGGGNNGSGDSGGGGGGGNSNKRRSKGSSTAGGGNKENKDGHDDEQEPVVLSRVAKFKQATEYLTEMMAKRADFLNGYGDGYKSPYLLVRLPSLMEETETAMDACFNSFSSEPVDIGIRNMIGDCIDLFDLGMRAAVSFLDAADKAWIPVTFTSLASLANDLEELCISTISESFTRKEVKGALVHARDSELFELPTKQSPKHLAKHFLTMNVATKGYLLNLVHCAAGCGMFNSLDIEDLTTGKDPIVSRVVLTILDYDQGSSPESTDELLKSMRKGFDDQSNTHSDKTKLMLCLPRIRLEINHLSDERWETMEKRGLSSNPDCEPDTMRCRRYFDTQARKTNAVISLVMLVASTYIYEHTSSDVDFGDDQTGVDVLLYRNTIPFLFQSIGTKLLMAKTYDGTASDEYMESVHTGLGDLATKATTSSIGSKYHDDIAVLFDLDNDDEDDHDDLLVVLGYDKGGDGGGDDMEVESEVGEAVDM